MDAPAAHAFASAARRFLEVSASAAGHYDAAGGEWSVLDLLGHTSRSLSTVEAYLEDTNADGGPVDLADAVAYYLAIADVLADTAAAVQRGRAAGAALGQDPMAALVDRVLERVRAAPVTAVVRTPFGTMTLPGPFLSDLVDCAVRLCCSSGGGRPAPPGRRSGWV